VVGVLRKKDSDLTVELRILTDILTIVVTEERHNSHVV